MLAQQLRLLILNLREDILALKISTRTLEFPQGSKAFTDNPSLSLSQANAGLCML